MKQSKLDALCVTEHDCTWSKTEIQDTCDEHGVRLLRGMEVSTSIGHVLVFGLDAYVRGIFEIPRLREAVDIAGGILIAAHPMRSYYRRLIENRLPGLFDAVEVLNGGESDERNTMVLAAAQQLGLHGVGGSDAHTSGEVGRCATQFEGEIRNERDLIEAIRSGACSPKRLK